MVFIASLWTAQSDLEIPVFSNCDEVELRLNGHPLARMARAAGPGTQHLPHPPFRFTVPRFIAGTLEAFGFLFGRAVCAHQVATPGPVASLTVVSDGQQNLAAAGEPDTLLVHAELRDAAGTLCVEAENEVVFSIAGGARLIGPATVLAEAGIASVVVNLPRTVETVEICAASADRRGVTGKLSLRRGSARVLAAPIPAAAVATGQ